MSMLLPPFELHEPRTVEEAARLVRELGADKVDFIAGGSDLLPNYKWGVNTRPHVVSLSRVEGLAEATPERLGALVTLRDLERHAGLEQVFPVLGRTASLIASPLIRNSATLGGNLLLENRCFYFNQTYFWRESINFCLKADGDQCHVVPQKEKCYSTFSADLPAPLITLGAVFELVGPEGRRTLPAATFYTGLDGIHRNQKKPGELLTFVHIPRESQGLRATYQKLRLRDSWDFPELGIAASARFEGDRVTELHLVANALEMWPVVMDQAVEPYLGGALTDDVIAKIAHHVEENVRPVKNTSLPPAYRKKMAGVYTKRALRELRDGPAALPSSNGNGNGNGHGHPVRFQ
ncbi:MAG TPA: FAD binding domain-containing protein [Candidatus Thermoplasmatota archaeon]|nr:FAD binding domain-containing protein [Candidatus Thermoplasmatota archaeon]